MDRTWNQPAWNACSDCHGKSVRMDEGKDICDSIGCAGNVSLRGEAQDPSEYESEDRAYPCTGTDPPGAGERPGAGAENQAVMPVLVR